MIDFILFTTAVACSLFVVSMLILLVMVIICSD